MAGHLHLAPDARDCAICADEKGRALNAHIFAAVHRLFDPSPKGLTHAAFGVAAKRNVQIIFGLKLFVAGDAIL